MAKGRYGYKDKLWVFGSDAESYVSRLFMMVKNPQGSRRPDLISLDKSFSMPFSVEVKSGREAKGIMCDYQLHYAVTSEKDYQRVFGIVPPEGGNGSSKFLGKDWRFVNPFFNQGFVAYYYNIVDRVDNLTSAEINKPFSSIKFKWGNQFMVPDDLAFYNFVCSVMRRTGRRKTTVIRDLKEMMAEDCLAEASLDNWERKNDNNSFQNIFGRDVLAIFENDHGLATKDGRDRIKMLKGMYDVDSLRRIKIPGPNKTFFMF